MGILLIILVLLVIVGMIVLGSTWNYYETRGVKYCARKILGHMFIWTGFLAIIYGVVAIASLMGSYNSYLNTRAYYDNIIAQYKGAITLYKDEAVALDMEKAVKHTLTDLRFQGYQEKMGDFVLDLRKAVTRYNSTIIKKRLIKKNFFYGWYIIPPDDDMKTIDIISK